MCANGATCVPTDRFFQWASTIKIQLSVLVLFKMDIISSKFNLFSSWYSKNGSLGVYKIKITHTEVWLNQFWGSNYPLWLWSCDIHVSVKGSKWDWLVGLLCLMPLSLIFQLYHGGQEVKSLIRMCPFRQ
jgi:hypothetical protein